MDTATETSLSHLDCFTHLVHILVYSKSTLLDVFISRDGSSLNAGCDVCEENYVETCNILRMSLNSEIMEREVDLVGFPHDLCNERDPMDIVVTVRINVSGEFSVQF